MAWSSESAGSRLCNSRSTFARCCRSSESRVFSTFAISSCSFMACIQLVKTRSHNSSFHQKRTRPYFRSPAQTFKSLSGIKRIALGVDWGDEEDEALDGAKRADRRLPRGEQKGARRAYCDLR